MIVTILVKIPKKYSISHIGSSWHYTLQIILTYTNLSISSDLSNIQLLFNPTVTIGHIVAIKSLGTIGTITIYTIHGKNSNFDNQIIIFEPEVPFML